MIPARSFSASIVLLITLSAAAEARTPTHPSWRATKASTPAPSLTPAGTCIAAIGGAEVRYGTPAGLLLAIARVESGRFDPGTKQVQPWPWAVNTNGSGFFLQSKDQAISFVSDASKTSPSIDIGCMQVNLQQHPKAFRTIEDAFDPYLNADYAARYLVQLHSETGDWLAAAGFYHSHTQALAGPYRMAVQLRMGAPLQLAQAVAPAARSPEEVLRVKLSQAWATTVAYPNTSDVGWSEGPHAPRLRVVTTGVPSLKAKSWLASTSGQD